MLGVHCLTQQFTASTGVGQEKFFSNVYFSCKPIQQQQQIFGIKTFIQYSAVQYSIVLLIYFFYYLFAEIASVKVLMQGKLIAVVYTLRTY